MNHSIRRLILVVCAVAATALSGALPAPAAAQDTSAVAVNTKDNSSIFRLAFNIRRVTGDVVDQTNAAIAYASCQECRTVAISIQVLLVESDPSIVSPENLALAYNQDCTLCDTFASAYQIVLGDGTRLRFTPEGSQSIAQIRHDLRSLRKQNLSDQELDTQTGALVDQLQGVLDSQLIGVGKPTEPAPEPKPPTTEAPTATTTPGQPTPGQVSPGQHDPAQTTPSQAAGQAPSPTQTTPSQNTTPAPTQTTPATPQTTATPPASTKTTP